MTIWFRWLQMIRSWIPTLDRRVWILSVGRLLSQVGNGFTLFYAPIFFANQVGLSTTVVGMGIGSGSVAGIFGRILGGSMCDSPQWGRRSTLLLSAAISTVADGALAIAQDFPLFLVGNLLMGVGIGLYWPATEAVVADITPPEQGNESFAVVRLADSLGLGTGVILGGFLIQTTGSYRLLFVLDGLSYLIFFGVIYVAIAETLKFQGTQRNFFAGWNTALRDRALLVYAVVNTLFTTYLAQVQSTLPVYFTRFVSGSEGDVGFSESTISLLFTWHITLISLLQLPIARWLNRWHQIPTLITSALLWGCGFALIGLTGMVSTGAIAWAVLALGIMAIATVVYFPAATMFVVNLAPERLRGVYLSISSLCWALGYFIGPTLGGWALDQAPAIVDRFWLAIAASVGVAILILRWLSRTLESSVPPSCR